MSDIELTVTERAALLALLAEGREVPNAFLANTRGLELKKPSREKLVKLELIHCRTEKRRYFLELDEKGWSWCREQLGAPVPARAGAMGAAMYSWLANLPRHLGRAGLSLADVFGPFDGDEPEPGPKVGPAAGSVLLSVTDIEARIRKAYGELARRPGGWVKLADLRSHLDDLDRAGVDGVLVEMNRSPDVTIVPESNQKTLTQRDRDAAVRIGNQDKHLLLIDV